MSVDQTRTTRPPPLHPLDEKITSGQEVEVVSVVELPLRPKPMQVTPSSNRNTRMGKGRGAAKTRGVAPAGAKSGKGKFFEAHRARFQSRRKPGLLVPAVEADPTKQAERRVRFQLPQ